MKHKILTRYIVRHLVLVSCFLSLVSGAGNRFDNPNVYGQGANIRKIHANTNKVTTIAGSAVQGFADGTTSASKFNIPTGISVYQNMVYVLDRNNLRIRKITY